FSLAHPSEALLGATVLAILPFGHSLLLIVMMSSTGFWIHPTKGGPEISVAVTSMLTLIAYRFAIGSEVPKLPYLTRLDAFILASSLLVFLSLIEVMLTTKNSRLTTGEVLPDHRPSMPHS